MSWFNVTDFWKTVVYGLIAGAGLPALFAVGLYALSRGPRVAAAGADGGESSETVVGGSIIGMIVAAICFLVILAAIGWGVHYIYVAGHPAPKK